MKVKTLVGNSNIRAFPCEFGDIFGQEGFNGFKCPVSQIIARICSSLTRTQAVLIQPQRCRLSEQDAPAQRAEDRKAANGFTQSKINWVV